jgi:hypothetical protein
MQAVQAKLIISMHDDYRRNAYDMRAYDYRIHASCMLMMTRPLESLVKL